MPIYINTDRGKWAKMGKNSQKLPYVYIVRRENYQNKKQAGITAKAKIRRVNYQNKNNVLYPTPSQQLGGRMREHLCNHVSVENKKTKVVYIALILI
jgi:hypothetical protein